MSLFFKRSLLAVVLLAVALPAAADTLVLDTSAVLPDAWMWSGGGSSVNKEGLQLEDAGSGYLKHVFLGFDLSSIAAGSTIQSAIYSGNCNGVGTGGIDPGVINVYTITKSWVEDEVSWANYSDGNAWTTPGGDAGTLVDTIDLPLIAAWGAISFDLTASVQALVDGTNNGLLLKFADGSATQQVQWCGSEANDEGSGYTHVAPLMTIQYIPEPATMSLLGLGGLSLLIRRKRK